MSDLAVAAAGYKRVLKMTASEAERRAVMYGTWLDETTVGAVFDVFVDASLTNLMSLARFVNAANCYETRFPDCEADMGLLHDPDLLDASSPPTPPPTGKWMGEEANCTYLYRNINCFDSATRGRMFSTRLGRIVAGNATLETM